MNEKEFCRISGKTKEELLSYLAQEAKRRAIRKKILQIMNLITAAMWIFIEIVVLLRLFLQ